MPKNPSRELRNASIGAGVGAVVVILSQRSYIKKLERALQLQKIVAEAYRGSFYRLANNCDVPTLVKALEESQTNFEFAEIVKNLNQ